MQVQAKILILAKVVKNWADDKGVAHKLYVINISQADGQIIDTLRLSEEQFDFVEAKKDYLVTADYGTGRNGAYLRIVDILPAK